MVTARPYRVEVARGTDPNRQIRSLVIDVHLVGSRRICPAQVRCAVDPSRIVKDHVGSSG